MPAQVFWSGATRRSLCSSQCVVFRHTRAYYSQPAHSFIVGSVQDSEASASQFPDTKNSLDPSPLDRYLASIRSAHFEPTLVDVERSKPGSFSAPNSPRYAAEYTDLLETLCRSFSKDQLRRFTELYKLDPIWTRSSRRKTEYAESIIEKAWGWPSLKEIERKRRDATEIHAKSFAVTPSQLFLMMGKDGADLLQLSMLYNVHISFTSSPLALRVEGLRGSLRRLADHISSLKKGIIDEIFELSSGRPVRPDLLQHISQLSGAYVENHGDKGKIRICAKDLVDIATAKGLALRASLEAGTRERTLCYDPPCRITESPVEISQPRVYAMYPFVIPFPLPWTMLSGGTFRLRRVADWLGLHPYEEVVATGGLADNPHHLLNLNMSGDELRQVTLENASYHHRTVTVSPGHILISSGDNPKRNIIFPPLRGTFSLRDVLKWIEFSKVPLTFVPSIPSSMMTVTVDEPRDIHQLIYRTLPQLAGEASMLPQHVLRFEMELPCRPSTSTRTTHYLEKVSKPESMLSSDESKDAESSPGTAAHSDSQCEASSNAQEPRYQAGMEAYVNLMLPDRPTDLQLCIFDWDGISPAQQPQVLREFAHKLRNFPTNDFQSSQHDPPPTIRYEGREYYLYSSLNLRRCNHPNLLSTVSNSSDGDDDTLFKVATESFVDLQGLHKTELFQLKFDGTTGEPSWQHCLAACDQFSAMFLEPRSKKEKPQQLT